MFNFIKKQFIDVIQWPNPDDSLLMWRFPIADEEIQNGASLTVREAQMAMFVDEGVTADVFGPGRYTLNTQTLPVLTNLKNWDKLFESPFKSDVYFFNTKQQLARKWGTSQPVTVRDAEFGAVQLRSFGMYSYRISDPAKFFKEVSGVAAQYSGVDLETSCAILRLPSWRPRLAAPVSHSWIWRRTKFCCRKKSANCLARNLPSWVWRWKTSLLKALPCLRLFRLRG